MMGTRFGQLLCINILIILAQNNDFTILQALKDAWQNTPPTWDDGSDPCGGSWDGITCTNDRVTRITLGSMQLMGELPGDIGQLTESGFCLSGPLTWKHENLRKLTHLSLVGCSFTGPIPGTIGNLGSLISLEEIFPINQ